jgi:hypothetical protein
MTRQLTDDETFQPDGHLNDAALTALTDGQDEILPQTALDHGSACDACAERMGELALLSVQVHQALAASPELVLQPQPVRASFPVGAMLAALVIAVIGAVPTLLSVPAWLAELPAAIVRNAPITLRATSALVRAVSAEASFVTAAWLTAATVLVALGLLVARLAPRQAHQLGGGR